MYAERKFSTLGAIHDEIADMQDGMMINEEEWLDEDQAADGEDTTHEDTGSNDSGHFWLK